MDYVTKLIAIDDFSATPKYIQLVNSIIKAINEGKIQKNDVLPSINVLSSEFQISRDTVEKGYKYLKNIGILGSITGKGYFVRKTDINQPYKILLLFNKLSAHKKIIYDAFVEELGELASIDFYIYNNDFNFFKKILNDKIHDDYSHYVIIPHFIEGGEYAPQVLDMIEREKLILLDKKIPGIKGKFGIVYENFELDIYNALEKSNTVPAKIPDNKNYISRAQLLSSGNIKGFF